MNTHLLLLQLLMFEPTEMLQQVLLLCLLRCCFVVLGPLLLVLVLPVLLLLLVLVVQVGLVGPQERTQQPSAAPWRAAGRCLALDSANRRSELIQLAFQALPSVGEAVVSSCPSDPCPCGPCRDAHGHRSWPGECLLAQAKRSRDSLLEWWLSYFLSAGCETCHDTVSQCQPMLTSAKDIASASCIS